MGTTLASPCGHDAAPEAPSYSHRIAICDGTYPELFPERSDVYRSALPLVHAHALEDVRQEICALRHRRRRRVPLNRATEGERLPAEWLYLYGSRAARGKRPPPPRRRVAMECSAAQPSNASRHARAIRWNSESKQPSPRYIQRIAPLEGDRMVASNNMFSANEMIAAKRDST
jgi:hypothetical protein